jgi:1-acyl-sn-glycerol-3-phosphate acyltransferase
LSVSTDSSFFYRLRSKIFDFLLIVVTVIIPVLNIWAVIFKNRKGSDFGGKSICLANIWLLKKVCNIDYKINGLENIPKENGFIVACKHQSVWDTMIMFFIFHRPAYAYKKELLSIPFYGWMLRNMSGIKIDRNSGASAIKSLIKQSQEYINNKQNIIIFPQGTRSPVGANVKDYPYQSGLFAIYNKNKCNVTPVALNSGFFWNKNGKRSGTITVEFLPHVSPGLKRDEFNKIVEKSIETKSLELLKNAKR